MAVPRVRAVERSLLFSISRAKGEYSTCTAEMWWIALARSRERAEHSDRPRYLIFPSLRRVY